MTIQRLPVCAVTRWKTLEILGMLEKLFWPQGVSYVLSVMLMLAKRW